MELTPEDMDIVARFMRPETAARDRLMSAWALVFAGQFRRKCGLRSWRAHVRATVPGSKLLKDENGRLQ